MSPTQPTKRRSGKTNMCPHRLKIFGINFISHSSLRKCLWTYFLHWMNTHQNIVQDLDVGWLNQIALRNMILFSHRYITVMISWRSRYQIDRIHIWMKKASKLRHSSSFMWCAKFLVRKYSWRHEICVAKYQCSHC